MIVIEKYEVVKFIDGEFELEVNVSPNEETIWMTLDEIAILFERDRSVIGKHIRKIYLENELNEKKQGQKMPDILKMEEYIK